MIISEEERNRIKKLHRNQFVLKEETVEEELTDFIEVEELPVGDEGKYCVTDNLELKLIKTNQIVVLPWWKFWKKKNKANNPTLRQRRRRSNKRLKKQGKRIWHCKVVNR